MNENVSEETNRAMNNIVVTIALLTYSSAPPLVKKEEEILAHHRNNFRCEFTWENDNRKKIKKRIVLL